MSKATRWLPSFSLRGLAITMAVIAVQLWACFQTTPFIAGLIGDAVYISIFVAVCIAIGARQPGRSFWLGFAITTIAFLTLHRLSYSSHVKDDIFIRKMVRYIQDTLPEVEGRGQPNTSEIFAYDNTKVVLFKYDETGKRKSLSVASLSSLRDDGRLADGTTIEDLPHVDHQPASAARTQMLPFCLAFWSGLLGGSISYLIRRRSEPKGSRNSE